MPISTRIDNQQLPRSGVALGGIGSGSFTLFADGTTGDWSVANNLPLGTSPLLPYAQHSILFFVLRWQEGDGQPLMRLLQIPPRMGAAGIEHHERLYIFPWLDGVETIEAELDFPGGTLRFYDQALPVEVELHAWSPFIPHDVEASSLPLANFDLRLRAKPGRNATVTAIASLRSLVGYDVPDRLHRSTLVRGEGYVAAIAGADRMPAGVAGHSHPTDGEMALVSMHADTSHYLGWEHIHPYWELALRGSRLPDLDDTAGRNHSGKAMERCWSSLARTFELADGASTEHRFAVLWHFPHRVSATGRGAVEQGYIEAGGTHVVLPAHHEGVGYSARFPNATALAEHVARHGDSLLARTQAFRRGLSASTLPRWMSDLVADQLNTLRTSTWLTADGSFGVIEGLSPSKSFAGLATVDVAYYGSVATAALFPALERGQWAAHARLQQPNGVIPHSITKDFTRADPREASGHRVDLPAQFVHQALRLWAWTGDQQWLAQIWPHCVRALDYVLRERDADGDLLPDMQGVMCSYDNFPMYGVAPYVATQWLAAIALAERAAAAVGDEAWRARCAKIREQGTARVEATCWNGTYYRLYQHPERGADEGCLADQAIGDWAAHLTASGPVLDAARVRSSLAAVWDLCFHAGQGLRNCQWPGDGNLHPVDKDCWVDQANTCWTGVEFTYAAHCLYAGLPDLAMRLLRDLHERHQRAGLAFDHQEFGGHYYRPLSAWSVLHAAAGLEIADGIYTLRPQMPGDEQAHCLSYPCGGWGHYRRRKLADGWFHVLEVSEGHLELRGLRFGSGPTGDGKDSAVPATVVVTVDGAPVSCVGLYLGGLCVVTFSKPVTAKAAIAVKIVGG